MKIFKNNLFCAVLETIREEKYSMEENDLPNLNFSSKIQTSYNSTRNITINQPGTGNM